MKHLYILFLVISVLGFSQEKYLTKSGVLNFEASVDTFEEIKATNDNVTAIFNAMYSRLQQECNSILVYLLCYLMNEYRSLYEIF